MVDCIAAGASGRKCGDKHMSRSAWLLALVLPLAWICADGRSADSPSGPSSTVVRFEIAPPHIDRLFRLIDKEMWWGGVPQGSGRSIAPEELGPRIKQRRVNTDGPGNPGDTNSPATPPKAAANSWHRWTVKEI